MWALLSSGSQTNTASQTLPTRANQAGLNVGPSPSQVKAPLVATAWPSTIGAPGVDGTFTSSPTSTLTPVPSITPTPTLSTFQRLQTQSGATLTQIEVEYNQKSTDIYASSTAFYEALNATSTAETISDSASSTAIYVSYDATSTARAFNSNASSTAIYASYNATSTAIAAQYAQDTSGGSQSSSGGSTSGGSSSGIAYRIGAICTDGWVSDATGSGACSHHGGVRCWRMSDGSCEPK